MDAKLAGVVRVDVWQVEERPFRAAKADKKSGWKSDAQAVAKAQKKSGGRAAL